MRLPQAEIEKIWKSYKTRPTDDLRNRLIENYLPIVRYTAERMMAKLPQHVDVNDLYQAGTFGLMDAIDGFDLSRGIKFETYCTQRIRGSILDELRKVDWAPRLVRSRATKLDEAYRQLEHELGREPSEYEIAQRMGITVTEFDNLVREVSATTLISLSDHLNEDSDNKAIRKVDLVEDKATSDPVEILHKKEMMDYVTKSLSKKERLVILLYYYEELTMKEIGLTLDLSESRVCQLHSRILLKLKRQLGNVKSEILPD